MRRKERRRRVYRDLYRGERDRSVDFREGREEECLQKIYFKRERKGGKAMDSGRIFWCNGTRKKRKELRGRGCLQEIYFKKKLKEGRTRDTGRIF